MFGPHCDACDHKSSQISIALHVNDWVSYDYVSSDKKLRPWIKGAPGKTLDTKKET